MGYKLFREAQEHMPDGWDNAMYHAVLSVADKANESTRRTHGYHAEGYTTGNGKYVRGLADDLRMSPDGVTKVLKRLADRGCELRVIIGTDKNGKPVFGNKGHGMNFAVPLFPLQSPPPQAAFDEGKARTGRRAKAAKARTGRRLSPPPQADADALNPSDDYSSDARDDEQIVIGIFAALGEDIDRDGAKRVIEELTRRAKKAITDLERYATTAIKKDPDGLLLIAHGGDGAGIPPWERGGYRERGAFGDDGPTERGTFE